MFGVCLGLQAMVEHAGGELSLLPEPQHGKPGQIQVRGEHKSALFACLPAEFTAARYHSIYAKEPACQGRLHRHRRRPGRRSHGDRGRHGLPAGPSSSTQSRS